MKRNIIVIGGSGQLGQCLNEVVSGKEQGFNFVFLSKTDLDFVDIDLEVILVASTAFVTKAKRPHYSVMDKKNKNDFWS